MKRLPALLVALTFAALGTGHASAQNMKPGQWEMTNKMMSSNGQANAAMASAMKQLANMPPEQRAQVEAMMAQHGASMPRMGADGGMSIKACVTPEMAARHEVPTGQGGKCIHNNTPVAGGIDVSFSCTEPPSSGKGQVRFNGDTGFTMNMDVTSSATGQIQQMKVETTGRWLGPNCPK